MYSARIKSTIWGRTSQSASNIIRFGRRINRISPTTTSIFASDGDNLIEETNYSGTAVARYSQGLNIDEPLAMLRSSTTSYYEADGLGSITSFSSGSSSLAETYTFDSFGKQTASSGSLTNPFQYTARESDPETGLYYYRARYYDPNVGRFTKEDAFRFDAGANFYLYVGENPIDFVDPLGLCPLTRNQRIGLAGRGLLSIAIGAGKVAGGIGLIGGTGGVGAVFGGYAIISGLVSNVGGGLAQLAGAVNGDGEAAEAGANGAAAVGSVSGLLTLAVTHGNVCKAAQVAKWEGLGLTPFQISQGIEVGVPDAADAGQNGVEVVTGRGCSPPKPESKPCSQSQSQGCPK